MLFRSMIFYFIIIIIATLISIPTALICNKGLLLRNTISCRLDNIPLNRCIGTFSSRLNSNAETIANHRTDFRAFSSSILRGLEKFTSFFPFWVLLFSLIGFRFPELLLWFTPFITPALALTMTSMGMTLSVKDFVRIFKSWKYVLLGFIAQYSIMPFTAAFISKFAGLSTELATGLILVGCAPGGTASNIVISINLIFCIHLTSITIIGNNDW